MTAPRQLNPQGVPPTPGSAARGYFFGFGPRFCGFQRNVEGTIQTPLNWVAPGTLPALQSFCTRRIVVPTRLAASAVVINFAVSRRATELLGALAN